MFGYETLKLNLHPLAVSNAVVETGTGISQCAGYSLGAKHGRTGTGLYLIWKRMKREGYKKLCFHRRLGGSCPRPRKTGGM